MAILPEEIKDNKESDLKKRVDTLYEYVKYMHENLEFYASTKNKTESSSIASIEVQIQKASEDLDKLKEELEGLTGELSFDNIHGGTADAEAYKVNGQPSVADLVNDTDTPNTDGTKIPVIADGKLQFTSKDDICKSGDISTVLWENGTLRFYNYGRIVICHLNGVTYRQLTSHTLSGKWTPAVWTVSNIFGTDNNQCVTGEVEFNTDGTIASYYYSNFQARATWGWEWKLYGTAVWLTNSKN